MAEHRSWTVLVGVDGSEHARDALAFGARLAQATRGHLIAASVYGYRLLGGRLESGEHAAALVEDALSDLGLEATRRIIPATSPAEGLDRLAETERANMIVLGSRHHGRLGEALPGRVTRDTLRRAPCAVAVVPTGGAAHDPLRSVGVLDDQSSAGRHAEAFARALAASTGEHLVVFGRGGPPALGDGVVSGGLDLLVVPAWPHGLRGRLRRPRACRLPEERRCALMLVGDGAAPPPTVLTGALAHPG